MFLQKHAIAELCCGLPIGSKMSAKSDTVNLRHLMASAKSVSDFADIASDLQSSDIGFCQFRHFDQ